MVIIVQNCYLMNLLRTPETSTARRLHQDGCELPDGLEHISGAWLLVSTTRCAHHSATSCPPGASGAAALVGGALCPPSAPAPSSAKAHSLRGWRALRLSVLVMTDLRFVYGSGRLSHSFGVWVVTFPSCFRNPTWLVVAGDSRMCLDSQACLHAK